MRPLALLLAAGLALAACGEAPRPATEPRVRLELELPDDGRALRAETVQVQGSVRPADAAVRIAGEQAEVDGGQFQAEVTLRPGANVIDITATAPGRRPATDAVRITRDMRVEVPSLAGQDYETAAAALSKLGLKPVEDRGGSWIDRVLGTEVHVCGTTPRAGQLVLRDTKVTVATDPDC